eukprot:TRINITY_DN11257_c0_g1_i2.p1 TRINITY_DN11257_c0_g1~~TRINITY_DN11257_c0_g1_i2.p1  ORF type:complete len:685 (-),score=171.68 TRINITY_DN11257_c0_g1_i2:66-2120(-)
MTSEVEIPPSAGTDHTPEGDLRTDENPKYVERTTAMGLGYAELTVQDISNDGPKTASRSKPKNLTIPVTPKFATESRARVREATHGYESFDSECSRSHNEQSYVRDQVRAWENKLTVPESPAFHTNARVGKRPLETSEDMELKRIKAELDERAKRRKIVDRIKEKALAHPDFVPQRSVGNLTEPEEFRFRTEDRNRMRSSLHSPSSSADGQSPRLVPSWTGQLTEPVPFSFKTDDRAAMHRSAEPEASSSGGGGFVSAAEQRRHFLTKTPDRFHTRGKNDHFEPAKYKAGPMQLTEPSEFHFHELRQYRAEPVLSTKEREEMEALNAPKFKANSIDYRIFESRGPLGVKAPEPLPLTIPEEFHFRTDERLKGFNRSQSSEDETSDGQFRAQPFPEHIFKPQPAVQRETPSFTVPQSPMLATKQRAMFAPQPKVYDEPPAQFKARPILHFEPIEVKKSAAPLTQPEPFQLSTEDRGRMAQAQLQRQMQEQARREAQMREIKAKPMPIFDEEEQPKKPSPNSLTEPEPFQLATDVRHAHYEQQFKQRVQREMEQENRQHEVHAKPYVPVTAPFFTKRSTRPLTDINEPLLASDQRALAREEFNARLTEKHLKQKMEQKMAELEALEVERKEIKEYRKSLRHKPKPVLPVKPVVIRQSTAPLTVPQSPAFATKTRFAHREQLHASAD